MAVKSLKSKREHAHLASLGKYISTCPDEVCGIKTGLKFSGEKLSLSCKLMSIFHAPSGVFLEK